MTPSQLERAVAGLAAPIRRALLAQLAQWKRTAGRVALREIEQAIAAGQIREVVRLVLGDQVADVFVVPQLPNAAAPSPAAIAATSRAEEAVIRAAAAAFLASTRVGERLLPPKPPTSTARATGFPEPPGPPIPPRVVFTPGVPAAAARAAAYGGEALAYLRADAAAGVRAAVEAGLRAGINPRDVARGIRDIVGLGESQAVWVANLRAELEAGRYGAALDRKLINGNLARTIASRLKRGKPLTAAETDKIVAGYADKWRAWHAETVARTMTTDVLRANSIRAMRDAVARGDYAGLTVRKEWVTTLDGRERAAHRALNGVRVLLNAVWVDDGVPRDMPGGYNCRCGTRWILDPVGP